MNDEVKELLLSYLNQVDSKGRKRKIIFWYDDKQDYINDINELSIKDANIRIYDNDSFKLRYEIEIEKPTEDFIIYFPFDAKKGLDNELLDLETANEEYKFNPDQTTMWLKELNLADDEYYIVKINHKFFKDKKRRLKFNEFDSDEKNSDTIDSIIIACLLNLKSNNKDEIFKKIIVDYYEDKKRIDELFKWSNNEAIFDLINHYFGSKLKDISELENFFKSLVFTYFVSDLESLSSVDNYSVYILPNKTNVHIFVDMLMRDSSCKKYFEKISNEVVKEFGIKELLNSMNIKDYKYNDAFELIDRNIIDYICDALNSDIGQFEEYNELIQIRSSKYWSNQLSNEYNALKIASKYLQIITDIIKEIKTADIDILAKNYVEKLSEIDTLYRKFYFYVDKIETNESFKSLKTKIENKYVNNFINDLSIKWSKALEELSSYDSNRITLQNTFFKNYIKQYEDKKSRVIVIISDAFRYEVANELNNQLLELGAKSSIEYMLGLVPSYTKLGMASLLPNTKLSRVNNPNSDDILVDDMSSSSLLDREKILQKECDESLTIKYDDLYDMTKMEWKKLFSGKKIVYIYHDSIDNAGEHDENKVFDACARAIDEIYKLVKDLHTTFSGVDLYITADHGFFYKKSKTDDASKIKKDENANKQKKRYSYSDKPIGEEGYMSFDLKYIFGDNSGYVNIPKGNAVFSIQGLSSSYVHGGAMPQEIIIPVIDFKSTRNIEEASKVKITYSGMSTKITNAIVYLDFAQNNAVDENNKPSRYLLHFEDENKERISNECVIIADNVSKNVKDRFFKEKFVFKNIKYDRESNYYLVITDEETGIEIEKVKFVIDIAITNNFNF